MPRAPPAIAAGRTLQDAALSPARTSCAAALSPHALEWVGTRGAPRTGGYADPERSVAMETSKTILVPTDFQDASIDALAAARELAGRLGLEIVLLHTYTIPVVVYPGFDPIIAPGLPEEIRDTAKSALEKLAAENGGLRSILRA